MQRLTGTLLALFLTVVCGSAAYAATAPSGPQVTSPPQTQNGASGPAKNGWGQTIGSGAQIGAQDGGQATGSKSVSRNGGGRSAGSGSDSGATTCTAHGVTGPISSKVVPDNVIEGWYTGGHSPSWAHGYDYPGTFYYIYCGTEYYGVEYIAEGTAPPGGGTPAPAIDPQVLAVAASKNIPIGQFTINLNPAPPHDELVGLPMWMWVSNGALGSKSDSVTAGTVTVTATAKASKVVFDMGDGHTVTCVDPDATTAPSAAGTTSCSYTYPRSSSSVPGHAYKITATVVWDVNYAVSGAPGGGALPAITRTATTTVRVAEEQAINTPG